MSVRECVDCIGVVIVLVVARSCCGIGIDGGGDDLPYSSIRRGNASLCRSRQYSETGLAGMRSGPRDMVVFIVHT